MSDGFDGLMREAAERERSGRPPLDVEGFGASVERARRARARGQYALAAAVCVACAVLSTWWFVSRERPEVRGVASSVEPVRVEADVRRVEARSRRSGREFELVFDDALPGLDEVLSDARGVEPVRLKVGVSASYAIPAEDDIRFRAQPGVRVEVVEGRVTITPERPGRHEIGVERARRRVVRTERGYTLGDATVDDFVVVVDATSDQAKE